MNHIIAENFMRSAKAPQISAGVMIANVIWNAMYTDSGIVRGQVAHHDLAGLLLEEHPVRGIVDPCSRRTARPA